MFISTSTIQNAVWGWASKPLPATGKGNFASGLSRYSNYTLGPDGWVYALPSSSVDQALLVINPGQANSNKTNYAVAAGSFVVADGSPTRPTFMARDATAGATFESKGIVAPNGKIYFFTKTHRYLCELTPAGLSSTWKFHDLSASVIMNSAGGAYAGYNYFLGVILGKDGYLYLIPNGRVANLARINITGPTPVVENSYYDGSVTAKIIHTAIKSPLAKVYTAAPSSDCFSATAPTTVGSSHWDSVDNPNNSLLGSSQASSSMSAGLACLDPVKLSNKIYFTVHLGTWVMWIDPNNWNNANAIGTVENLWLRKLVTGYGGYRSANTVLGCLNSSFKFGSMTPGANRKLYINITNITLNGGLGGVDIYDTTENQRAQHTIEIDTTTNVATLVVAENSQRILGYYGGSDMMPNGYIFATPNALQANTGLATGSYHRKVLQIDTNYATAKVKPEAYTTVPGKLGWNNLSIENPNGLYLATHVVTNNLNQVQFNNIVVLPGDKRGKVIIAGRNNTFGVELMSVKGFYKGVTHFDLKNTYDPTNNVNKIEMPSSISTIATSDYNIYYNKIT